MRFRDGTALILAAHGKRVDIVETLLRVGADPNLSLPSTHRNYPSQTALDVAKKAKASKVVAVLEGSIVGNPTVVSPKQLDDLPKLWKRIKKALKSNPAIKKTLRKGASDDQIDECEATIGVALPSDFRAIYRIHDGQKKGAEGLFSEGFAELDSEYVLLSLSDAIKEWKTWNGLLQTGQFKKQKAIPDAGVRSDWWNPKWIPFATDGGGDSLCVDLAPAKGGTLGQVILHQHADHSRSLIASSIQALFDLLAGHLEDQVGE